MIRCCPALCCAVLLAAVLPPARGDSWQPLQYAPAPVDNPLKGLVPYRRDVRDRFPHSMEFTYLPYSALVKGYDEFDWRPLERVLNDVAGRGHQAVFRVYLEFPGRQGAIPEFLLKDGLRVHKYMYPKPRPPVRVLPVESPDYQNENLRRSLKRFLAALGERYDGDPRIGFITAGLLGAWGEWHTYPRPELFAGKTVQEEVMTAYEAAFRTTHVLLRYPAGENDPQYAANSGRRFGYHDDSFAWATLHTGRPGDEWFYMTALKAAGPDAVAKWKRHPIGGEIRPEAWGRVFDDDPGVERIQNFRDCVEATHVTWLLDSGMFARKQPPERVRRAMEHVRRMGYEFHCPRVSIGEVQDGKLAVKLEIENRGVAPFYYDWQVQWSLLADGAPVKTFPASGKVTHLLPGEEPRLWADTLDLRGMKSGRYVLAVQVMNPLAGGKPLRFGNQTQDAAAPAWLSLGHVCIPYGRPP